MSETLVPSASLRRYVPDLFSYRRRRSRVVMVGKVGVGGANPIRVQSMTTTDTLDPEATFRQTVKLAQSGCEIVRITAPTVEDARAIGKVKEMLARTGLDVAIVADIHFNPAAAAEAAECCEKVRINPGNFVDSKRFALKEYTDAAYAAELARIEERFTPLVDKLKRLKRACRIGVNHGSLCDRIMNRYGDSPLGMVESALEFARIARKSDYHDLIFSMKASNPKVMIAAYRLLAARMDESGMDYPLHLGVTEAGDGEDGRIKSAIGIGSLLEDGLGDTIRVSLTEPPELEIPVCRVLTRPFNARPAEPFRPESEKSLGHCADFYGYSRRRSESFSIGPVLVGGLEPVRAFVRVPDEMMPTDLLAAHESILQKGLGVNPEVLEFDVRDEKSLDRLKAFRATLKGETSRLAFLARADGPLSLVVDAAQASDLVCWVSPVDSEYAVFLQALKNKNVVNLVEAAAAEEALQREASSRGKGVKTMTSLRGADASKLLQEYRLLAARGASSPIFLRAPREKTADEQTLRASTLVGGLLCDGVGDAVLVDAGLAFERGLALLYNILQGAGARITKTEFVSCPSCGRTLFDLQTTTAQIKARTGHLKGVKIAIMGCIVNGPGEMADADFGYVGGAPGMINLYVGKDCVQKGIPMGGADDALVELIKNNGKWVEPK
ncbi:MAG TPA: 4-hydroxy-3-methylbut-2-en-1-yl diphosphate synthase [Elusimicrobia bacterium]|nr:MAG: 4-hydroxy-3-methylbut-2-en-1-yl diphosphate synthase [Elusimicrobia bacterium GWA2_66_18]HAZ08591.1 4-hydroxy-3-methylbut-2-en-1-yl diphosphate synthase [Elusimicrobiota bacterium]